jgi:transcriptional regulator with XRE-family HTH domain
VTVNEPAESEWVAIGERIRTARESARMSVRELARRVEVSPSHVSQAERGLAKFSVRTLYSVVNELGVSMDSLFAETSVAAPVQDLKSVSAAAGSEDSLERDGIVLRADSRPTIPLASGTRWERLTPRPESGAEFIEVVYPPVQDADLQAVSFAQHSSREYGIVIRGTLTVQVGFERSELGPGDSIAFDSMIPHRFWNETPDEVRCVWFIRENAHSESDGDGRRGDVHAFGSRISGS